MALLFLCPGHVYTQDPKRKPHTLGSAIACWWPQRTLLLQLVRTLPCWWVPVFRFRKPEPATLGLRAFRLSPELGKAPSPKLLKPTRFRGI